MKHIEHIKEYFGKLNENFLFTLFKNEKKLKGILMKDKNFANGDVADAIRDVIYTKWQSDKDFNYNSILDWSKSEYGVIPYFTMMFGNYDGQVCNGGHSQYYDNGYASSNSQGFGHNYENIDIHEDFVDTFEQLDMRKILPYGNKMYNVISNFTLDLDEEIEDCAECAGSGEVECDECDGDGMVECSSCNGSGEDEEGETCSECDGEGQVDCDECNGKGVHRCDDCDGSGQYDTGNMIPDLNTWDTLDSQWYEINEQIEQQYDDYLKTLTLDGDKIEDLIELAKSSQSYNI